MEVFLETERLALRRFTEDDVDNLFNLDGDPEVMRFLTGGKPTPRGVIQNKTLPRLLDYYERFEGFGCWAAVEKSTGEFLGWFEFRPQEGDDTGEVELGYRLNRSAWGKGYATEGSRALIHKGFTERGACEQRRWRSTWHPGGSWRKRAWHTCARSTWSGRTPCQEQNTARSSTRLRRKTGSSGKQRDAESFQAAQSQSNRTVRKRPEEYHRPNSQRRARGLARNTRTQEIAGYVGQFTGRRRE